MLESRNLTRQNFSKKYRKRDLEREFADLLQGHLVRSAAARMTHNSLILCGPALTEHYETHIKNISKRGKLVFAEWDPKLFLMMQRQIEALADPKVELFQGDIFNYPHDRKWTYIDLDFCKSFKAMEGECALTSQMHSIANGDYVNQEGFGLSITLSHRGDAERKGLLFLRNYVPAVFEISGWNVRESRVFGYSQGMTTSFYFFVKRGRATTLQSQKYQNNAAARLLNLDLYLSQK